MKHFLLWGVAQVLASVVSGKQVPSAKKIFLIKMGQVPGLTSSEAGKYPGTTVVGYRKSI